MTHVVTAFLRHRGEVLLVQRSDAIGTYQGKWGGVSGYVEGGSPGPIHDSGDSERSPPTLDSDDSGWPPSTLDSGDSEWSPPTLTDARRELAEEVGVHEATLVRAGDAVEVDDEQGQFTVHPFLFDLPADDRPDLDTNEEIASTEWVQPPGILARETVPALWAAYEAVAPTVDDVRTDETHGSAAVSLRALEVLRDRAAAATERGDDWEAVAEVARDLRDARPGMAALATRVNRVMAEADRTPEAVLDRAMRAVDDAVDADDAAADNAADLLRAEGVERVCTLSRSGTVLDALRSARPAVLVAESRTAREGVDVAEELAREGLDVTLTTDAAAGFACSADVGVDSSVAPEALLVGADTVLADGSVVNKVGTRALALAAAREGVPVYVAAARDKVAPEGAEDGGADGARDADAGADPGIVPGQEFGPDAAIYEGDADLDVWNPVFDRTPGDLVSGVVTEDGVLDGDDVAAVAADHAELARWNERVG
ncbi:translation initiation factor 2 [Halobium salinum]|uniref:Translation initiation factor 2 n=1 Tax=Halobium salinum TaxID=1364940 RepID=A0ABD5PBT2_9EURY|nr:translation initiation factor 2 [Halobium salinum]